MQPIVLTQMQTDRLREIATGNKCHVSCSPQTTEQLEDLGLVYRESSTLFTLTVSGREHLGIRSKPTVRTLERRADELLGLRRANRKNRF